MQGWGGVVQLPVSGIMSGNFSTATASIDLDAGINCGGPQPWEVLAEGGLLWTAYIVRHVVVL